MLIKHSVSVCAEKIFFTLLAKKHKNLQVIPAEVFLNPAPGNNCLLFLKLWWSFGRILRCIWQLTYIDSNKNYVPEFHEDPGLTAVDVDFGVLSLAP